MTVEEAYKLLMLASARDGRQVDKATATVWADDLESVAFADAVLAAKKHYQASDKWLMPAHVLQGAKRLRDMSKLVTASHLAEIAEARSKAVPMPEHVRAQMFRGSNE